MTYGKDQSRWGLAKPPSLNCRVKPNNEATLRAYKPKGGEFKAKKLGSHAPTILDGNSLFR